jgi:RimJ/RimL family protein N-acetyltransferase
MTTAALTLRRAGLEDGPFLLTVRNEDNVRSLSKSQGLISEETHKNWLERHLGSSETAIWIIERESQKLGYVRAQKIGHPGKTGQWLLSVALTPVSRGKRYGTWAVAETCRFLRETFHAETIVAEVQSRNAAALRLFATSGFVMTAHVQERGQDLQRLELSLSK